MARQGKVSFEFKNQIVPRYIEPLLLQIEYGRWYTTGELQWLLRDGLDVDGKNIVLAHTSLWPRLGLGEVRREGRFILFRLSPLAKLITDLYSTNRDLFFDVFHFLLYSAWPRSRNFGQAPFWLYTQVCNRLWTVAPAQLKSFELTAQLQTESRLLFPGYSPAFSERSVRSVFVWLQAITPPFLTKQGAKAELHSHRRAYCTPQLFHLAIDLLYTTAGLTYGTALTIDDEQIAAICRPCLLDPGRFWDMASLAAMAMRELELRQGQWGTSLVLNSPPRWIELPAPAATPAAEEDAV
jgi:hypothetical protein